jgi:mycofactocin precursor peptide peptidase
MTWYRRGGGDWRDSFGFSGKKSRKSIAAHAPTIGARQVNSAYHLRVAFPTELATSTSRQLQSSSPSLIVPVGSVEQHGPHLPLDTDTRIATAVARSVVDRLAVRDESNWALAPAIGYGASGEHEGFPGTVSIGTSALRLVLVEFGRSASQWASRLVFVNGHGGNVEGLAAAVALLRREGRDAGWCSCTAQNADAHAGHTETSVLLHISPTDVWVDERLPGNREPLARLMPQMRKGGVAAVSELGVLGDPTTATAADGERILSEMIDACLRRITRWAPDRDGMLT